MRLIVFLFLVFLSSLSFSSEVLMSPISDAKIATDFTLPVITGNMVNLSEYKGKYVLINFWALWCSPCIKELPAMQKMFESLQVDSFEIIAIHVGPPEIQLDSFLAKNNINFTIVIDEETSLRGWDVPVLPMSYLVNPSGKLIYKAVGPREWNVSMMRKLISSI